MWTIKSVLASVGVLLCAFSGVVNAEAVMKFDKANNGTEAKWKATLEASTNVQAVMAFINERFTLDRKLLISYGNDDGPLFDGEENTIYVPYSFMQEVEARFINAEYGESGVSPEKATIDALVHTLFHEFAHAVILFKEIPVVGREEDAADSLATVLLTEYFDNGQGISISAADLFYLESYDYESIEDIDFSGEHSFDAQRYYSIVCHVYGSDPDKYKGTLETLFTEERAELCIDEYEQVSRSWMTLLKPYMK